MPKPKDAQEEKYAAYVEYRAAMQQLDGGSKTHAERLEELTYERGYQQGRLDAARERYEELLTPPTPGVFDPVNQREAQYRAETQG